MWAAFLEELSKSPNSEEPLRKFVVQELPESEVLDYKWQIDLTKKPVKRDIADWICGFANNRGGLLVLGVQEKEDKSGTPIPDAPFYPVKVPDRIDITTAITNIVHDVTDPIPDFIVRPVLLANGGYACVIFVPPSPSRPHVLLMGEESKIPIRRPGRFSTMGRIELDHIYSEKKRDENEFQERAIKYLERYKPSYLETPSSYMLSCPKAVPYLYMYLEPEMSINMKIDYELLKKQYTYKDIYLPICDLNRLPHPESWITCDQAASYDNQTLCTIAYRNGALSVFSAFNREDNKIGYIRLFASLYNLVLWSYMLQKLGILTPLRGIAILKNAKGSSIYTYAIPYDPEPIQFTVSLLQNKSDWIEIVFHLLQDITRVTGDPVDLFGASPHPMREHIENVFHFKT